MQPAPQTYEEMIAAGLYDEISEDFGPIEVVPKRFSAQGLEIIRIGDLVTEVGLTWNTVFVKLDEEMARRRLRNAELEEFLAYAKEHIEDLQRDCTLLAFSGIVHDDGFAYSPCLHVTSDGRRHFYITLPDLRWAPEANDRILVARQS